MAREGKKWENENIQKGTLVKQAGFGPRSETRNWPCLKLSFEEERKDVRLLTRSLIGP